jgi:hypothetical protein
MKLYHALWNFSEPPFSQIGREAKRIANLTQTLRGT